MQRFFVGFPLSIDITITDKNLYHQLTRVLRIQVGDHVILFDGDGSETEYEVLSIDKKSINLRGQWRIFPNTESKKKISLYQAMPNKYEKIEYIIQKWVEVGISEFIFFRSDRSQKLTVSSSKIERYISIAREAVEQCGGMMVPRIVFYEKNMSYIAPWVNIALDTIGVSRTFNEFDVLTECNLWIGPEGGWSGDERDKMISNDFIFARFGERVLRTETAGVVTAFGLLYA